MEAAAAVAVGTAAGVGMEEDDRPASCWLLRCLRRRALRLLNHTWTRASVSLALEEQRVKVSATFLSSFAKVLKGR